MKLFYKVPRDKNLKKKNQLFKEKGLSSLMKKGFTKSPFSTSPFGKTDSNHYVYELGRLSKNKNLELIQVYISSKDDWIKVYLNIFRLSPSVESLDNLNNLSNIRFHLPPNSNTKMHLREDDFKGIPLFNFVHHKIGSYHSEKGFEKRIIELGNLIKKDMSNIDSFVKRWHQMHTPLETDWEGHSIESE